jgi:hypothetical protein
MAIINCPSCNKRISSVAVSCEYCKVVFDDSVDDEKLMREMRNKRYTKRQRIQNISFLSVLLFATGAITMYIGITDSDKMVGDAGRIMLSIGFVGYVTGRILMFMSRKK